MKSAIPVVGWLVLMVAGVGAAVCSRPDDPLMASFKASGLYETFFVTIAALSLFVLIWIVRTVLKSVALHRRLDDLKQRKDR